MARTKFPVEVLTPEGEVFNDEVEMVSTRTTTGSIGVLANHAPLLAILDPTELRLYKSESDVVSFAQGEGYLQVADNQALVLVEEAISPDDLDHSDIESKLEGGRAGPRGRREGLGGALPLRAQHQALQGLPGGRGGLGLRASLRAQCAASAGAGLRGAAAPWGLAGDADHARVDQVDHVVHEVRVEAGAAVVAELGQRLVERAVAPVGVRARHVVERVGRADDAALDRDVVAGKLSG